MYFALSRFIRREICVSSSILEPMVELRRIYNPGQELVLVDQVGTDCNPDDCNERLQLILCEQLVVHFCNRSSRLFLLQGWVSFDTVLLAWKYKANASIKESIPLHTNGYRLHLSFLPRRRCHFFKTNISSSCRIRVTSTSEGT